MGGDMTSVVPAGLTRLFQHPTLDWNLFSTKQQQLTNREVSSRNSRNRNSRSSSSS
jgi:hypothetical protein